MKEKPVTSVSCTEILTKIGALPTGFTASASYGGGDFLGRQVAADDWVISITAKYHGKTYNETYFLQNSQLGFVSAVRDKLMMRHWQRMRLLSQQRPLARREWFLLMQPYSNMEALNYAGF